MLFKILKRHFFLLLYIFNFSNGRDEVEGFMCGFVKTIITNLTIYVFPNLNCNNELKSLYLKTADLESPKPQVNAD